MLIDTLSPSVAPTLFGAVQHKLRTLLGDRYAFATVQLFREIREELIWADGGAVKKATDAAILSVLGPKTEADQQAGKKKPAKKVSRYMLPL